MQRSFSMRSFEAACTRCLEKIYGLQDLYSTFFGQNSVLSVILSVKATVCSDCGILSEDLWYFRALS